jgi:hypothetical protein
MSIHWKIIQHLRVSKYLDINVTDGADGGLKMPENPWWYLEDTPRYVFQCLCGKSKYYSKNSLDDMMQGIDVPEARGFHEDVVPKPYLLAISSRMRCTDCGVKGKFLVKRFNGPTIFDKRT